MKRNHDFSSSDSELDENIEVEKESADENGSLHSPLGPMSPSTTTQVQARKRRRGIIEKRRRDRINNSLTELRRLVPSAFEKQGSAKLEKAEILQMTVDHLKMLHAAGGKGYFDAHALAMDYRGLGFRECLAETARYLSLIEGLDSADPLRIRLVSHLNSYAMQREAHSGLAHLGWGSAFGTPAPPHLPPPHHHHPLLLPPPPLTQQQQSAGVMGARTTRSRSPSPPSAPSSSSSSPVSSTSSSPPSASATVLTPSSSPLSSSTSSSDPLLPRRLGGSVAATLADTGPMRAASGSAALSAAAQAKLAPPLLTSLSGLSGLSAFPFPLGAFPLLSPRSLSPSSSSASAAAAAAAAAAVSATAKPYRPWSMEIGAF